MIHKGFFHATRITHCFVKSKIVRGKVIYRFHFHASINKNDLTIQPSEK